MPPEIGNLTNLTTLSLRNNQLSRLPPEIGNLTNLTELNLGRNQLSSLPAEIGNLTNLTRLYLYDNQLSSLPEEIGNLTNLTLLYIDDNQLDTDFYCFQREVIEGNNPGIDLRLDPNPNPWTADCSISLVELAGFTGRWLDAGCGVGDNWCGGADMDHDGLVDLRDFGVLGYLWLKDI